MAGQEVQLEFREMYICLLTTNLSILPANEWFLGHQSLSFCRLWPKTRIWGVSSPDTRSLHELYSFTLSLRISEAFFLQLLFFYTLERRDALFGFSLEETKNLSHFTFWLKTSFTHNTPGIVYSLTLPTLFIIYFTKINSMSHCSLPLLYNLLLLFVSYH